MRIVKWDKLPVFMQQEEIREYYEFLKKKTVSLFFKRVFDIIVSIIMIIVISPVILAIAIMIKADSKGPVFYRQERVTQYGRVFRIFKFRSMIVDADTKGTQITVDNDCRVTRIGRKIRKYKLDELPQLFNVLSGDMSYVGARPEVQKYVDMYKPEMLATLLLPAGMTSLASIYYKDENSLISNADDVDKVYMEKILPEKMRWNLKGIMDYSFTGDMKIMMMTAKAATGKDYNNGDIK